jgi:hypothetical protein
MNNFLLFKVTLGICSFWPKPANELRYYDVFDMLTALVFLVLKLVLHEGSAVWPPQL